MTAQTITPPVTDSTTTTAPAGTQPTGVDLAAVAMLSIDGETLSLDQILRYYQISGKLVPWLREIIEQHVIFQGIQQASNIDVSLAEVEQRILDFRIAQNLQESDAFQQWLHNQSLTFELFQMRVLLELKLAKFKTQIATPNLERVFHEQKALLDEVEVTLLAIANETLAQELKQKLDQTDTTFDQVVQEYAMADPLKVSIMKSAIRQGQLPEDVRTQIQSAQVGDLLGPLTVEGRWCIFRVEQFMPAVLEGNLKTKIEGQLFQQWLSESVQKLSVEFTPSVQSKTA